MSEQQAKKVFESMIAAANRHDLESMVSHFAPDYRGELPLSPEKSFTGQAIVRKNWSNLFSSMSDFQVEILDETVEGDTVWAELFFHGTRADGTPQMMLGVNIMNIQDGHIIWGKLYQDTVQAPPRPMPAQ
jgi:ketosteroid isomerase-like protein